MLNLSYQDNYVVIILLGPRRNHHLRKLISPLQELIDFNNQNSKEVLRYFGQDILEESLGSNDEDAYENAIQIINIQSIWGWKDRVNNKSN